MRRIAESVAFFVFLGVGLLRLIFTGKWSSIVDE